MPENETTIREELERAIEALFNNQPNIFDFTSETNQTEWNLAHHLANEICRKNTFSRFDCDLEVTKPNLDRKRPDIIFHRRGNNDHNFLVVEMKRNGDLTETADDEQKIKEYWFDERLRYKFGAVVNIHSDKTFEVKVLRRSDVR